MMAILEAKKTLHKDTYFEIKYEDFVCDSNKHLQRICAFLGLEYEEGMLNFYSVPPDSFVTGSYHVETNRPISDQYVGIHEQLPVFERLRQIEVMGEMLEELGYKVTSESHQTGFWEDLRNKEEDDHGGMMMRGGVELMHDLHEGRKRRLDKGFWQERDKLEFLERTA